MQENQTQQHQEQQENETQVSIFSDEFDSLINAHGKITPSLLTSVNRFFLYFSFFESLLFDCAGSQNKSVNYAKKLLEMDVVDKALLQKTYGFFLSVIWVMVLNMIVCVENRNIRLMKPRLSTMLSWRQRQRFRKIS
ncbi:hypothetical protein [Klebsiella quasipneumoniae]|uniref:hypothetical protein n=1 Tax=Klebsiella quasipneumoniae TaxID=1463165 RepID=UPI00344DFA37